MGELIVSKICPAQIALFCCNTHKLFLHNAIHDRAAGVLLLLGRVGDLTDGHREGRARHDSEGNKSHDEDHKVRSTADKDDQDLLPGHEYKARTNWDLVLGFMSILFIYRKCISRSKNTNSHDDRRISAKA